MFAKLDGKGRNKKSWSLATFGGSMIAHGLILGGVVYASVIQPVIEQIQENEDVTFIDFGDAPPPPPPPPPPPADVAVAPEAPPVPLGFQQLVLPDVIPTDLPDIDLSAPPVSAGDFSGLGIRGGRADGDSTLTSLPDDLAAAPRLVPYDVTPSIRNLADVQRALQQNYPPLLRSAGVGGRVLVWFFINTEGRVANRQVKESSGYPQLDEAALNVADVFVFSPAMNRDERVPVWIEIPIDFTIAAGG